MSVRTRPRATLAADALETSAVTNVRLLLQKGNYSMQNGITQPLDMQISSRTNVQASSLGMGGASVRARLLELQIIIVFSLRTIYAATNRLDVLCNGWIGHQKILQGLGRMVSKGEKFVEVSRSQMIVLN